MSWVPADEIPVDAKPPAAENLAQCSGRAQHHSERGPTQRQRTVTSNPPESTSNSEVRGWPLLCIERIDEIIKIIHGLLNGRTSHCPSV